MAAGAKLVEKLTDAWLRKTGYAYARGVEYAQEGRAEIKKVDADAVYGVVAGGRPQPYAVIIALELNALVGSCTCPMAVNCKHVVAVGYTWLQDQRIARPVPPSSAPVFATRKDFEEWTAEHQVPHLLVLGADVLLAHMQITEQQRAWLAQSLARLPLGEVGTRTGASRYLGSISQVVATIPEAAYRFAHAMAEDVQRGVAEEHPFATPEEPKLAQLATALIAARTKIRRTAAPRSTATRLKGSLTFDALAPALHWLEPGHAWKPTAYTMVALATTLTTPGGGTPVLACTCGAKEGACTHALALIDTLLERMTDPRLAANELIIAEAMLRPSWARALAELDRFEAAETKQRTAIEVWWKLDETLGSLGLTAIVKKQLKSGKLSSGAKLSPLALVDEYGDLLSPQDRAIAEQYAAWSPQRGSYPVRAFQALVDHPRVLALEEPEPIRVQRMPLGFSAHPIDGAIQLEPTVDNARFNPKLLRSLLDIFSSGEPLVWLDTERARLVLIDVADEARRLWAILEAHGDSFPPESHAPLLERLAKLETRLPIAVPERLKGRELVGDLRVVARLRLLPDATLEVEAFVRPAPGAPLFAPSSGPRDVLIQREGERGYIKRDLGTELEKTRLALTALPLGDAEEGPPNCFRIGEPEQALHVVMAAQRTDWLAEANLEVEWIDKMPSITRSVGAEALKVTVEKKRDWFGIVGEIKVETGRLELAVLLDAARRQQRFVRIDANRWIELADTLRKKLLAVSDQVYEAKGRLEISPGAVPAIRELAMAGAQVQTAQSWEDLAQRAQIAATLKPKVPASLAATLRDYQIDGHAWLSRVAAWGAGAVLADDMGLGKTVQAIALLLDRAKQGPTLVIAPTSVAYNWVNELQRFAPSLEPILYGLQSDRQDVLRRLKKKDVLIASYGLLTRDATLLAGTKFSTLVLDEAQALKNANTRRARAARSLDAQFRVALTGTPFENHLGELWSLMAIVFPGLLGSWDQFRERYALPVERGKDPDARAALTRVLRPFLLRRTKAEVARELPPRTEIDLPVALSSEEHTLYEDARLAAVAELSAQGKGVRDEQRRFQVLAALTRLRLLASHPKLYDSRSTIASSKLRRLLELLEELKAEGHRVLIFSQFTSHLALVKDALAEAAFRTLYLDGSTPMKERASLIDQFQTGDADAFLISLKAGGTGINLTAADYVIHLDPWWNPAVEDQATDRAHRIGQTKPVTVYRLIARGTIEEQILSLHASKRALVAGVLEGTDAGARLSTTDLLSLLAGTTAPVADDEAGATVH